MNSFPEADTIFARSGCDASWLVMDIETATEIGHDPEAPQIAASTFKVFVALELCLQAAAGELDPSRRVHVSPDQFTLGGSGVSLFEDAVDLSLRDLAKLMMSISDNAATDILIKEVGLQRINARLQQLGLRHSVVTADIGSHLAMLAADLGFDSYRQVLAAQRGQLGAEAKERASSRPNVAASRAVDMSHTTRTSARDMVHLLRRVWRDEAGSAAACEALRQLMGTQTSYRIGGALPPGHQVWAKSGTMLGVALNEVGVIRTHRDRLFAVGVFTRAHKPFERQPEIISAISQVTALAVARLSE